MNQFGEMGIWEYSMVPGIGDVDLEKHNASLFGAFTLHKGLLEAGLTYNNHNFNFYGTSTDFDTTVYESMHTLTAHIAYRRPLNTQWSINVAMAPMLSSNFNEVVSSEDFVMNAFLAFIRSWSHGNGASQLTMGIGYGTLFGSPRFFPIISFKNKVNERWSYSLGIPQTGISYAFTERHVLRARVTPIGLYANSSEPIFLNGIGYVQNPKLRFNGRDFGLEHNYRLQPRLTTVLRVGYTNVDNLDVLDDNNGILYDFEPDGSPYITMGIQYNLND